MTESEAMYHEEMMRIEEEQLMYEEQAQFTQETATESSVACDVASVGGGYYDSPMSGSDAITQDPCPRGGYLSLYGSDNEEDFSYVEFENNLSFSSSGDFSVLDVDWGKTLHTGDQGFQGSGDVSWSELDRQVVNSTCDNTSFKDQNAIEAEQSYVGSLESPTAAGVIGADGNPARTTMTSLEPSSKIHLLFK